MNETPRTDSQSLSITPVSHQHYSTNYMPNGNGDYVPTVFAKQLERELAEAKAELAKVRGETCKWKLNAELYGTSGCNQNTVDMIDNKHIFQFCPYCGKRIEEVKP